MRLQAEVVWESDGPSTGAGLRGPIVERSFRQRAAGLGPYRREPMTIKTSGRETE